jgi:hypothetical protein
LNRLWSSSLIFKIPLFFNLKLHHCLLSLFSLSTYLSLIHSQPLSLRLAPLSLSLTQSLSHSLTLTAAHACHLTTTAPLSLAISPSLMLTIFLRPHACDLTAVSISLTLMLSSPPPSRSSHFVSANLAILAPRPRSLSPSHNTATHPQTGSPIDPSKGHGTPTSSLSLTLTLKFCSNVGLLVVFLFFMIWSTGLLV